MSVRCIALLPFNSRGGYSFMSFETGKKIHGFEWTELAITEEEIKAMYTLADFLDEDGIPKIRFICRVRYDDRQL